MAGKSRGRKVLGRTVGGLRRKAVQGGDRLLRAVNVKQELQRLVDAVRKKFKELRRSADEVRDSARPFVEPLQRAVSESIKAFAPVKTEVVKTEVVKTERPDDADESLLNRTLDTSTQTESTISLPEKYVKRLDDVEYRDKLDYTYGVRADGKGGTVIGDSKISFTRSKIYVKDKVYMVTRGLLELLFMKVPNRLYFTQSDLSRYKEILITTNAHRQSYSAEKPINSNRGKKYTTVISPMFFPKSQSSSSIEPPEELVHTGSGVQFTSYNDNVNTLVDRLRLLVMSRKAGHTGHDIEISQIINTLRQNRIVA